MTSKVKGVRGVVSRLRRLTKEAPKEMGKALHAEGFSIMRKSKRLVPVDTGRLKGSGFVEAPQFAPDGPSVRIGYGVDYALAVHEREEVHHENGQAKYLSTAVNEAKKGYSKRLANRAQEFINRAKKGGG